MPSDMNLDFLTHPVRRTATSSVLNGTKKIRLMQHLRQLHGTGARLLGEAEDAMARWIPDIPKQVPWFSWRSNDTQLNNANIHHIIHTSIIHIIHIIHIYIIYIIHDSFWKCQFNAVHCLIHGTRWTARTAQSLLPWPPLRWNLRCGMVFFYPVVFMEGFRFFGILGASIRHKNCHHS